jgi:hypothetical protein
MTAPYHFAPYSLKPCDQVNIDGRWLPVFDNEPAGCNSTTVTFEDGLNYVKITFPNDVKLQTRI